MATVENPSEVHLRRTPSQELSVKQRELFLFYRGCTSLILVAFCVALPIYIYAADFFSNGCSVPLGSWQWSFTIFLWLLLASFIAAFFFQRLLVNKSAPGNIAVLPALVLYIATAGWLIYGTVLLSQATDDNCDSSLRGSSLGIIIAAWSAILLLGCVQGFASIFSYRQAPKWSAHNTTAGERLQITTAMSLALPIIIKYTFAPSIPPTMPKGRYAS